MKVITAVSAMLVMSQSAWSLCSLDYKKHNESYKGFEERISSVIRPGKTVVVESKDGKTIVAKMSGKKVSLYGKTRQALKTMLSEHRDEKIKTYAQLAKAIHDTDDNDVVVTYLYDKTQSDTRPDYISLVTYGGDNQWGAYYDYKTMEKVMVNGDGDLYDCKRFAFPDSSIKFSFEENQTEVAKADTGLDMETLGFDKKPESACYTGSKSGALRVLRNIFANSDMLASGGYRIKNQFDENDVELENTVDIVKGKNGLSVTVNYPFADTLPYELELDISKCKK